MQKHGDGQKITDFTGREEGKKEEWKLNSKREKWFDMFLRSIDSREEAKWYKCPRSNAPAEGCRKG